MRARFDCIFFSLSLILSMSQYFWLVHLISSANEFSYSSCALRVCTLFVYMLYVTIFFDQYSNNALIILKTIATLQCNFRANFSISRSRTSLANANYRPMSTIFAEIYESRIASCRISSVSSSRKGVRALATPAAVAAIAQFVVSSRARAPANAA